MNYKESDWYKARVKKMSLTGNGEKSNKPFDKTEYQRNYMKLKRSGVDTSVLKQAEERAERAKRYASRFPEHIRPGDEAFATTEWQLEQLIK